MIEFDKGAIIQVRKEVEEALNIIAKKHALSFSIGNISYDDRSFHTKIEGAVTTNGEGIDETKFKRYAYKFNIPITWYGRVFIHNNQDWKIVALKDRARKYPIIAQCNVTGKRLAFTVDSVKHFLGE